MKFTPETLLQIYMDGSFTDEAQAEFDALMRRDPAFAEKVTQALAERLGPVPEGLVDQASARLDAKIDGIWNRHKPAPALRYLKWGVRTALAVGAAAGLFLGGRLLVAKLTSCPSSGAATPASPLSGIPATVGSMPRSLSKPAGDIPLAPVSSSRTSSFETGQARISPQLPENSLEGQKIPNASMGPAGSAGNGISLPPVATANQAFLHSLPPSNGSTAENARAVTTEGDSLRVAIDLEQPQRVDVTVFDANGLLIRHLYNGVVPLGEHYVDWDGKDELGNAVLPGDYTVILDRGGKKMSGILKVLPNR